MMTQEAVDVLSWSIFYNGFSAGLGVAGLLVGLAGIIYCLVGDR